ncbi:Xaa-Pro peptidase family protein, partial [uncultured Streptococcus sp.]|uniref:M24 family metallopeptidase n=1 Tax=uncultured Streptococcus sp. TaxID=83427 RepID=UPI0028D2C9F9
MQRRLERFDAKLAQSGLDALLVTGQNNIYYLTDFWGTNATVFITKNRRLFLTDSRYTLIAKQSVHGFDIIESKDPLKDIVKIIEADKLETIGFDNQVSFAYYQGLQAIFEGYTLSPQSNFMEELRMIKDEKELATIRKACSISDRAFTDVLDFIKPGQTTELQVANFLDFRMREYGASGTSFESIIASGYRSAMPHGVASEKVIQSGETLTMDFGCYYNHYVSDMTRTIHIGDTTDEEREIYDIVLRSNQALIDAAKAGMTRRDYDKVARDVIVEAGYGAHF